MQYPKIYFLAPFSHSVKMAHCASELRIRISCGRAPTAEPRGLAAASSTNRSRILPSLPPTRRSQSGGRRCSENMDITFRPFGDWSIRPKRVRHGRRRRRLQNHAAWRRWQLTNKMDARAAASSTNRRRILPSLPPTGCW